ncbi:uncharacterized protein LOC143039698 [Oratosquilla oratoria]|uniref:uncharacterized protein LOC143039698 n=1 Tax=Oratosquilla oratoria TaxID=337810 RepID=UPI003F75AC0F
MLSGRCVMAPEEDLGESPNINAHITKELVESCLQADKGIEADLLRFEEVKITNKGDNYMCIVTSIVVWYRLGSLKDLRTSYVVKINPQWEDSNSSKHVKEFFHKELSFYHDLRPALNRELQEASLPGLRTPRSPFAQMTEGKGIIFMDNLREQGFQMAEFWKGLDKDHTLLVVRELARLHGASFLLQKKSKVDLLTSYPYLVCPLLTKDTGRDVIYNDMMNCCAAIARLNEGYEKVAKYLEKELALKSLVCVRESLRPRSPFVAVTHGDCWTGNLLFRNDSDGVPVETMLVDLQVVRQASPANDLSYLFFSSLSGQDRRKNLNLFLQTYYDTLRDVVRGGGHELDFTLEDLCEEYERHCLYGIFSGLFINFLVVCGSVGGLNLIKGTEELMKVHKEYILGSIQERPEIKERFFSIFDDMIEKEIV